MNTPAQQKFGFAVAVAALGYFVDLYDIVIFGVVRVASLNELGITGAANTDWGIALLNLQMIGMLIGGFFWGVFADRYGRRPALLATIALYSAANIANAFVVHVEQYALLRFIAGVGLAGELGAGITLVSEIMPKTLRGYGTTVISFLGLVGALTASYVGSEFHWRTAYLAGGVLGVVVLVGRWIGLRESALFEQHRETRGGGELRLLFGRRPTLLRFVAVIAAGIPIWYASALFVNLSPEYGKALGLMQPLAVADVLRWQALGLAIGSAACGLASEWLRSRRRVIAACLLGMMALTLALMFSRDTRAYCVLMFGIGLLQGYWTVFITLSAEQFGTRIRATVATAVPNIVRAMTVPVTLALKLLWPLLGLVQATLLIGVLVYVSALWALFTLRESYGRELGEVED